MKREWRPGDVALVDGRVAFAWIEDGDGDRVSFLYMDRYGLPCSVWANGVLDARPVAVIDPEDREQVARLGDAFTLAEDPRYLVASSHRLDALQAAFREYADPKPPKPEEPTGLGAVVEDTEGDRWVRANTGGWPWRNVENSMPLATYAEIDVVRVLSEGVTE